jgi:hypothetical protein
MSDNSLDSGIVIRFIGAHDFVSRAIEWTTNSLWCHTEALSVDGTQWIGAHSHTGIDARPLDWCKPSRERIYRVPVSSSQADLWYSYLHSKIGLPYDYDDIVGLAIHSRIFNTKGRLICSSFMLEGMQKIGLVPLNVLPSFTYLVTPEILHLSSLFYGRCIPSVGGTRVGA